MNFFVVLPDKTVIPETFLSLSEAREFTNQNLIQGQILSERQLNNLQTQDTPSNSFIKKPWIGSNPLGIIPVGKPVTVPNKPLKYSPVGTSLYKPPVLFKKIEVID